MTIIDYAKYYKDISFNEAKWNQMDTLIVAILSYARIRGFKEEKSFCEFIKMVEELKCVEGDLLGPKIGQVAKALRKAKRYEKVKVENFDDVMTN